MTTNLNAPRYQFQRIAARPWWDNHRAAIIADRLSLDYQEWKKEQERQRRLAQIKAQHVSCQKQMKLRQAALVGL